MYSLIQDPDPGRREAFLSGYKKTVSPCPAYQKHHLTYGDTQIAWESAPHIPIHTHRDAGGAKVWVLGHIEGLDKKSNPAQFLFKQYAEKGYAGCTGNSGFHVFVIQDADNLIIGTDQLGLFPAYYFKQGRSLIVGGSPATPALLPKVVLKPDLHGITGILLTMHELDNRSVWEDVRRIPAGKILRWKNNTAELLSGTSLPVTDDYFSLPFESQVDIADEAMTAAMENYSDVDVLLSGGLDSRILAGYLKRGDAITRKCYTLGKASDIEWNCAHPVAKYLNADHQLVTVDCNNFARYATTQILQEQLADGFADLGWWSLVDLPAESPHLPFMNGFLGDAILGGSHIPWALNLKERDWNAAHLLKNVNRWGMDIESIKALFTPDLTEVINDSINVIIQNYQTLPGYPFQKAWQYDLNHRQRYHIAGALYRTAFRFWPAVPYTSNPVLKCAGGMPAASIMQRRIQKELLRREFPALAALPLDNNTLQPVALAPSVPQRIFNKLHNYLPKNRRDIRSACYYHRMFDIRNPGWKPLFEQVIRHYSYETDSNLLEDSKVAGLFSELLKKEYTSDIASYTGYKNLLGLSLLMESTKSTNLKFEG